MKTQLELLAALKRAEQLLARHCENNEADSGLDDEALAVIRAGIGKVHHEFDEARSGAFPLAKDTRLIGRCTCGWDTGYFPVADTSVPIVQKLMQEHLDANKAPEGGQ
jgi:hypothetical protein